MEMVNTIMVNSNTWGKISLVRYKVELVRDVVSRITSHWSGKAVRVQRGQFRAPRGTFARRCVPAGPGCDGGHYALSFGCSASGLGLLVGFGPVLLDARSAAHARPTSFSGCLARCAAEPWCARAAWVPPSRLCFLYNYAETHSNVEDCITAVKVLVLCHSVRNTPVQ